MSGLDYGGIEDFSGRQQLHQDSRQTYKALTHPSCSLLFPRALCCYCCLVAKLCPTLLRLHVPQPARLFCPWDIPGKNTTVGCHFLPHGFFPTWGSNPCLLHQQVDSLPLSHQRPPPPGLLGYLILGVKCQSGIQIQGKESRTLVKRTQKNDCLLAGMHLSLHRVRLEGQCSAHLGKKGTTKQHSETWIVSCVWRMARCHECSGSEKGKLSAEHDQTLRQYSPSSMSVMVITVLTRHSI